MISRAPRAVGGDRILGTGEGLAPRKQDPTQRSSGREAGGPRIQGSQQEGLPRTPSLLRREQAVGQEDGALEGSAGFKKGARLLTKNRHRRFPMTGLEPSRSLKWLLYS